MFDEHERAGTYDSPEYEAADAVFNERHFYRGDDHPAGDREDAARARPRELPRDVGTERVDR